MHHDMVHIHRFNSAVRRVILVLHMVTLLTASIAVIILHP